MSGKFGPLRLRRWLESLGERCEYCQTSESVTGIALEVDHIHPRSKGGETNYFNLCRTCSSCNTIKSDQTEAVDPLTGHTVQLFHPRRQPWSEHFTWDSDGARIIGITPQGRATVEALLMNNPRIVHARRLWVSVGWHPPF